MLLSLLSLFAGAALAPAVYRLARDRAHWLLLLFPLGTIAASVPHWAAVFSGEPYRERLAWAPSLGVDAVLALDGLSLVFLLLICGIGAFILIYASYYLRKSGRLGQFYAYLLLFMGAMVGVVLADNIFLLFIFWELTSISSFLLIGWDHEKAESRKAAQVSLVVTGGGGMMLLAGLVLLWIAGGETELSRLAGAPLRESPLYLPALLLVLGGAFTKSAQVPFHFWLPGAMAAPTPVSAYLHSATMVKAGIYLMARLHPALGGTTAWLVLLAAVGGLTMVTGAAVAATQTDLKRILAYSTVSALGALTLLLGLGTEEAILAALVYLVAHSLYKGALFLVAGILDHQAGTRDVTAMRGLARVLPLTAAAAILAAASSAGVGPLFGFIAKELFYEAVWQMPEVGTWILAAAVASSMLLVVVAMKVGYQPFFGGEPAAPKTPVEASWPLWVGPLVMATLGLVAGLAPRLLNALLAAAGAATAGAPFPTKLVLWHGFTPVLALSLLTLVAGVVLFFVLRGQQVRLTAGADAVASVGAQRVYDAGFNGTMRFAEALTGVVQSGYLRNYVLIAVVTLIVLLTPPLLEGHHLFLSEVREIHPPDAVVAVVAVAAALAVTFTVSRLAAAALLGAIGICVMILYVIFGALDLAITQIMVETLTVILLVLLLYHLPQFVFYSTRRIVLRDAVVSTVFGVLVALLVVKAFAVEPHSGLREFYGANSYIQGHGRNVVNVILVDFRALDTLGEVTVLMLAGIGVYALLRIHAEALPRPGEGMVSLVLQSATPTLMLLLLVFSVYALFRGHHEPGGGFIGGLLAATAFALHVLAFDVPSTRRLLRVDPRTLMGAGLLTMAGAGLTGLVWGSHFLEGRWADTFLPGLGMVHVGTPLLFDVGVYAVVMGMVLNIVLTAAEE